MTMTDADYDHDDCDDWGDHYADFAQLVAAAKQLSDAANALLGEVNATSRYNYRLDTFVSNIAVAQLQIQGVIRASGYHADE